MIKDNPVGKATLKIKHQRVPVLEKIENYFGKLARKTAYVKIPQPLIVISGLKEFQFVIVLFP